MTTENKVREGNCTLRARPARADREAVFRTVRGAMMFALNYRHGSVKKSSLVEMMGGGRAGRGLGGLDGAAQAGMILAELGRLRQRRRSIITARCAPPSVPCPCRKPCCRGWKENAEWGDAIKDLTEHVLEEGLAGTVSHYRLRHAMVARYFLGKAASIGMKQSLAEIAQQCSVHRNTVSSLNKAIVEHLKREEQFATYEIEGLLKEAGVID